MALTSEWVTNALVSRRIYFDYQPIVELSSRKLKGYEALTRCKGFDTESIIYAIESNELCPLWLSCQLNDLTKALNVIPDSLFVALNVGQDSLAEPFVVKKFNLFSYPERLHIEVLESVNLDGESLKFLSKLDSQIIVKADDIGFQFPWLDRLVGKFAEHFDGLKICKDLTYNILTDAKSAAACRLLIAYANEFGLDTTAEWVQSEQQAELLLSWGCKHGQGELFGLGEPLPS